jgi:hypothetical protein
MSCLCLLATWVTSACVCLCAHRRFVCDQSATGYGHVSADTANFMLLAGTAAKGASGGGTAPSGREPALTNGAYGTGFNPERACNLNFTWKTNLVCGLPNRTPVAHSANWGWGLLLPLMCFCGLYFIGGTLYASKQSGAKPSFWSNMPHHHFWSEELPSLVSGGVQFLQSGGKTQPHYSAFASPSSGSSAKKSSGTSKDRKNNKAKSPKEGKAGNATNVALLEDEPDAPSKQPPVSYSEQLSAAPRSIMPGVRGGDADGG